MKMIITIKNNDGVLCLPSCTKEERKKKKKNLLFADLPESADVRGLQVSYTLPDRPQHLAFPSEKA